MSTMTHHVFEVDHGHKSAVIQELASGRGRSLLFTRTKHGARKLARQLTSSGVPAVDLHGNLAQNARERNLDAFANGSVKVLVATDIAARGIHVDDIELVIHVDPPAEHKAYLHRSGRTARAGADGVVVTVMTAAQRADVRTLATQAGIRPTYVAVAPGFDPDRRADRPAGRVRQAGPGGRGLHVDAPVRRPVTGRAGRATGRAPAKRGADASRQHRSSAGLGVGGILPGPRAPLRRSGVPEPPDPWRVNLAAGCFVMHHVGSTYVLLPMPPRRPVPG